MRITLFSLGTLASAAAQSPYNISVDDFPQGSLDATAWSLIYTYPAYIFANWVRGLGSRHFRLFLTYADLEPFAW